MRPIRRREDKKSSKPTLTCPSCGKPGNQNIVDTGFSMVRTVGRMAYRRRRKCMYCGVRYTTYEVYLPKTRLYVRKRNNRRQPFDRDKLATSIRRAYGKRSLGFERLERMITNIEMQIDTAYHANEKREVQSAHLGQLVLNSLKELDHVAYIRYASVFHDFFTKEHFIKAVEMLGADDPPAKPDRT